MIVSASRRTDIPAFYARWMVNRLRAGFCQVANPFNAGQVSTVSLSPDAVEAVVFWTRDPRPLLPHLPEITAMGHHSFFLVTLMDNPRLLDPKCPGPDVSVPALAELAERLGPGRVTWRYDPIVLSTATPVEFHRRTFARLAKSLHGLTDRVVVSLVEGYRKTGKRLAALRGEGLALLAPREAELIGMLAGMREAAGECGMTLFTCAQEPDLADRGVPAGGCIDAAWLERGLGRKIEVEKDPHQRAFCGCVQSRDIGAYDTCLFGCGYCYATSSVTRAMANYKRHDPDAPILLSVQRLPNGKGQVY